jgi:photosystem II stability/assembly factor-like uncharacterized protein
MMSAQVIQDLSKTSADSNNKETLRSMQKKFYDYCTSENIKEGFVFKNGIKMKVPNWKAFKRYEYYLEQRTSPATGELPTTTPQAEFSKYINTAHTMLKKSGYSENWVNLGTNASAGGYAGLGRINCVAFHPTDVNTVWVGSPSGGIWKTTDGGASWSILNDDQLVLGVSDIIIPSDYAVSNTLYIATGDRDGGSIWSLGGGQGADNVSAGLLKSTDGGVTWNATGLTYVPSAKKIIYRVLINPTNSQMLIAATTDGIYKSTDGGNTWAQKNANKFFDLKFKPGDPSVVYASTGTYGSTYVFKSTNGGESWSNAATIASGRRGELAVSANDPSVVYMVVANSSGGLLGVYKSTDSGSSFVQVADTTKHMFGYNCDGSGPITGQGTYDICIAASPTDVNTVYIGGINTWKSTDGGATWNPATNWTSNSCNTPVVHADKHALAFQSGSVLFEGNDGGIYKTTDGALSWVDLTNGLVISQIYRIGVSKTDPNYILAGLQDNGSKKYNGGMNTWKDVYGGDGMECIIDYNNSTSYMYVTYTNGQIYRSSNGFSTTYTTKISDNIPGKPSGAWVTPYIMDPTNSAILYAGYDQVWKTTDRGNSWTAASQQLSASTKLRSLAIAPSNTSILYTADLTNMWKTTDGGATNWSTVTLPSVSSSVTYIAVKSNDPNTVWITYGGFVDGSKVYQSTDGGATWTNISSGLPNLPIMCVVQEIRATDRNVLFVGTDVGVYVKDGSSDWAFFSKGLPNVVVTELEIYYGATGDKLRAGTFGRGLWETDLTLNNVVGIPELIVPADSAAQVSILPLFKWSKVTGASEYTLQVSTDSTFASSTFETVVSDTQYSVSGALSNSTKYYWRVKAKDGSFSSVRSFTTLASIAIYLNYPINNATVYSLSPDLSWNLIQSYTGLKFDVILSTDSLFAAGSTSIIAADNTNKYTLSNLSPTTHYFWMIRVKTTAGDVISYSIRQDFTTYGVLAIPIPSWPVGGATVYTNNPTLYWYMGTPAYSYTFEIRYKESSSAVWSTPSTVGSSLSFSLTGLSSGTSYDWEVRSFNGSAYSDWSTSQSFVTFSTGGGTPPQPILSYPIGGATVYTASPVLYWYLNASSAGMDYSVQVSKYSDFSVLALDNSSVSNLYQQLTSLDPGTMYYWKVRTSNGTSYSSWSAVDSFYTYNVSGNITPVLTYPIGGAVVYNSTPTLYWYTLGGYAASQFEVQYAIGSPVFSTTINASTTSCVLPTLQYGGEYYWRVRAKQGTLTSEWSGVDSFQVTGKAGSLTPVLSWPVGGALSTTSPTLYWYVNSYVAGMTFTLEYADNSGFNNSTVVTTSDYSKALTGLTAGTLYYWHVKTYNGSAYSTYSTPETFMTAAGSYPWTPRCGSPAGGVAITTNSPVLSWFLPTATSGVSYELQYAETLDFSNPVVVENIKSTSYNTNKLSYSQPIYWRVRSKTTDGIYSQYSEPERFTPTSVTSVDKNKDMPKTFVLSQNYPNPFNPSTIIKYSLPFEAQVSIKVYNIACQEVSVLVNTTQARGNYQVSMNALNLPSGMYIYRMNAVSSDGKHQFSTTKKMMLLK